MSKKLTIFLSLLLTLNLAVVSFVRAEDLANRLKGRILLQIEENGEAWYVNPANLKRYYLGRPDDAFNVMKELGIGISNKNLEKIQVADANLLSGNDSDKDGLSDMLEEAVRTDKNKTDTDDDGFTDKEEVLSGHHPNISNIDKNFTKSNVGKIFLQVENNGEAWYVNEINLKRYYLGRPADAFNIMRSLGLGIANSNLEKIIANNPYGSPILSIMEKNVQDLINIQRQENGLSPLKWNDDLADAAREHSNSLANENINLIKPNIICSLPMIHHEGFDFGLFNQDRLKNRNIYYLSANAENIALIPIVANIKYYVNESSRGSEIENCKDFFNTINSNFKTNLENKETQEDKKNFVEAEIEYRKELVAGQSEIDIFEVNKKTNDEAENEAVVGWMNSPGHKKNILTAEYDEAGIGIVEVKNYLVMTQIFITRAECGYMTGPCCEKSGYYPYCYQPFECVDGICAE
jgi:hypothetical protein